MPELTWVGKERVVNHHHDVPFKTLRRVYSFAANDTNAAGGESGNRIIHGDNLEALKALLPEYEGRVKCIYIDPPYNTGNENWVYNDNVNDPKIRKWINQIVGKEGEDLSRHDKWLCMMYPRLKLLKRLLADDGAIFVSIDDNEAAHLRLSMDEIFGSQNFVVSVAWHKRISPANDAKYFSNDHDHIIIFAKKKESWKPNRLERSAEQLGYYKNPDNDIRGAWNSSAYTCAKTADERPNLYYAITNPNTGEQILPSKLRVWAYEEKTHLANVSQGLLYWGKDGKAKMPRLKRFLNNSRLVVPRSIWTHEEAGHNQEATLESTALLSELSFSTPKPSRLIERILQIGSDKNSIVLDSFAGSGTTAHAVLKLNQQDNGNRKFILIETMDYAETITAERVRRVMNGYGEDSKRIAGTGGSFDYYEIGDALFLEDGNLNEAVGLAEIRRYVAYTENIPVSQQLTNGNPHTPYLLGFANDTAYIFYYEPNRATTLDLHFLASLDFKPQAAVIYADSCLLNRPYLQRHNITFKKIPRDITRF